MIRHRKTLSKAAAAAIAGEVTPHEWGAPHLAFDFVAVTVMPLTLVAANVPAGGTASAPLEIDSTWRGRYDFAQVDFVRFTTVSVFPSPSNAHLGAQWSDDEGVTWNWFDTNYGPSIWNGDVAFGGGHNGGAMYSAWVPIVASAKQDVLVRFVGWGALVADAPPNWGALTLWAR